MAKLYRIPGTDVKIRIHQDDEMSVWIEFDGNDNLLLPEYSKDKAIIQALGFPTEKPKPQPVESGDLEVCCSQCEKPIPESAGNDPRLASFPDVCSVECAETSLEAE